MITTSPITSLNKNPSSSICCLKDNCASPGKPSLHQAQQAQMFQALLTGLIFQAPAIQGPPTGVTEASLAFAYQVIRNRQLVNKHQIISSP